MSYQRNITKIQNYVNITFLGGKVNLYFLEIGCQINMFVNNHSNSRFENYKWLMFEKLEFENEKVQNKLLQKTTIDHRKHKQEFHFFVVYYFQLIPRFLIEVAKKCYLLRKGFLKKSINLSYEQKYTINPGKQSTFIYEYTCKRQFPNTLILLAIVY